METETARSAGGSDCGGKAGRAFVISAEHHHADLYTRNWGAWARHFFPSPDDFLKDAGSRPNVKKAGKHRESASCCF
jgi:hypothetical protein